LLGAITGITMLPFNIDLIDGTSLRTVGDAANYLSKLSEDRRGYQHWMVAIRMLDHAMKEPAYLRVATMSLHSAVLLDGDLLSNPR
jgi:hypothetical protein